MKESILELPEQLTIDFFATDMGELPTMCRIIAGHEIQPEAESSIRQVTEIMREIMPREYCMFSQAKQFTLYPLPGETHTTPRIVELDPGSFVVRVAYRKADSRIFIFQLTSSSDTLQVQ